MVMAANIAVTASRLSELFGFVILITPCKKLISGNCCNNSKKLCVIKCTVFSFFMGTVYILICKLGFEARRKHLPLVHLLCQQVVQILKLAGKLGQKLKIGRAFG